MSAPAPHLSPRMAAAVTTLQRDRTTAEVASALNAAGVRVLLLKGPSIARWIYPRDVFRPYSDTDLLVSPPQFAEAERVLEDLGFCQRLGDQDTPGWRQEAHHWVRGTPADNVDLHRTLVGADCEPEDLWQALTRRTELLTVAGVESEVLAPEARALHLALHAAQHGPDAQQAIRDLRLGLEVLGSEVWRAALVLAEEVAATPSFATGLGLEPAGREVCGELSLTARASREVLLMTSVRVPGALGLEHFSQTARLSDKARFIARKLFPTPRFMRAWSGLARRGRGGLLLAYCWRPAWVIGQIIPGGLAWLRARGAANS